MVLYAQTENISIGNYEKRTNWSDPSIDLLQMVNLQLAYGMIGMM